MGVLSYEERLINLKLINLERRCEKGDMIQKYKIQNQKDQISWFAEHITRESRIKNIPQLTREIKPVYGLASKILHQSCRQSMEQTIRRDNHGKQHKQLKEPA